MRGFLAIKVQTNLKKVFKKGKRGNKKVRLVANEEMRVSTLAAIQAAFKFLDFIMEYYILGGFVCVSILFLGYGSAIKKKSNLERFANIIYFIARPWPEGICKISKECFNAKSFIASC